MWVGENGPIMVSSIVCLTNAGVLGNRAYQLHSPSTHRITSAFLSRLLLLRDVCSSYCISPGTWCLLSAARCTPSYRDTSVSNMHWTFPGMWPKNLRISRSHLQTKSLERNPVQTMMTCRFAGTGEHTVCLLRVERPLYSVTGSCWRCADLWLVHTSGVAFADLW